ncbi:DIS3-like exonuclease 2 [Sitophilus oryzae]|uniref:DIS3-like exonuclease 2 n=1 Tax=Sitophilus oryzae TaxID=7048 RepID=A0A6J2X536_SITOR|nr:DIS3-like exonuclease 2 [Sitophilus oryzae]
MDEEQEKVLKNIDQKKKKRRRFRKSKIRDSDKDVASISRYFNNLSTGKLESLMIQSTVHDDGQETDNKSNITFQFDIYPVQNKLKYCYFKQRNRRQKYINLKSYLGSDKTYIFVTKIFLNQYNSQVEQILEDNTSEVGKNVKNMDNKSGRSIKKEKHKHKKTGRRKLSEGKFPSYLKEEEVLEGLQNGNLVKGFLRINPKSAHNAYVSNKDSSISDYYIKSLIDRNRALEGDEVVLKVKPKIYWEEGQITATVVYILNKVHSRVAVGNIKPIKDNNEFAAFFPRDKRLPSMDIPSTCWPNGFLNKPDLYANVLFSVRMTEWSIPSYAIGVIEETIGISGDLKVETLSILKEFNLDITPFILEDIKEYLPISKTIKQLGNRAQLTKVSVYRQNSNYIIFTREFNTDELPQIRNNFSPKDLSKTVNVLQRIAVNLREARVKNGSLRIDQVKLLFSLNPRTGEPNDFITYENKESHRLIEEFMLLANISVAKKIYDSFPDIAFLRCHEPPKHSMLLDAQRLLERYGVLIDISSSGNINNSFKKYITADLEGLYLNTALDKTRFCRGIVLNHLFAKPMTRANYFCSSIMDNESEFAHYALSVPLYTHFTSPIRRYADIMVHRLLAASLGYSEKPKWETDHVQKVATNCNVQKHNAKRAGEASSDLYLAFYVDKHQPYIQNCVVIDVKDRSFDVIVLKTGSTVRVHQNKCQNNPVWNLEEIRAADINTQKGKKAFRLVLKYPQTSDGLEEMFIIEMFSIVKVKLKRVPNSYKLEGYLLRPTIKTN